MTPSSVSNALVTTVARKGGLDGDMTKAEARGNANRKANRDILEDPGASGFTSFGCRRGFMLSSILWFSAKEKDHHPTLVSLSAGKWLRLSKIINACIQLTGHRRISIERSMHLVVLLHSRCAERPLHDTHFAQSSPEKITSIVHRPIFACSADLRAPVVGWNNAKGGKSQVAT